MISSGERLFCLLVCHQKTDNIATQRHIDAVELCFQSFIEDIERTRPRYPEEEHDPSSEEEEEAVEREVAIEMSHKLVDV